MSTEGYSNSSSDIKGALGTIFETHSRRITDDTNTLKCASNENMK